VRVCGNTKHIPDSMRERSLATAWPGTLQRLDFAEAKRRLALQVKPQDLQSVTAVASPLTALLRM